MRFSLARSISIGSQNRSIFAPKKPMQNVHPCAFRLRVQSLLVQGIVQFWGESRVHSQNGFTDNCILTSLRFASQTSAWSKQSLSMQTFYFAHQRVSTWRVGRTALACESRLYGLPGGIESRSTRRVTHRGNCFAFDLYWYRKSFDFRVSAKRTLYVRVNECLAVYSANRARTRVRSHPLLQLSQCGHCVATGTKRFQPLCPHWRGGFFLVTRRIWGFAYANCMPIVCQLRETQRND